MMCSFWNIDNFRLPSLDWDQDQDDMDDIEMNDSTQPELKIITISNTISTVGNLNVEMLKHLYHNHIDPKIIHAIPSNSWSNYFDFVVEGYEFNRNGYIFKPEQDIQIPYYTSN